MTFSIGDQVFAKVKGYPYWPGIIDNILIEHSTYPKHEVLFFGSRDRAVVKEDCICHYLENKDTHGKLKTDNFKNKLFNVAIYEAEMYENQQQQHMINTDKGESSNLEDSLAAEISQALLKENEELRQALHETSNTKTMYELELEDKIQERENEIQDIITQQQKKETELNLIIETLKNKLELEKRLNLELTQMDELKTISPCKKCEIYKSETKNMIASIRALEEVVKGLKNENLSLQNKVKSRNEFQCARCFPPLHIKDFQSRRDNQNDWKHIPVTSQKFDPPRNHTINSGYVTGNRFEVLSDEWSSGEEEYGKYTRTNKKLKTKTVEKRNKSSGKPKEERMKVHKKQPQVLTKGKRNNYKVPANKSKILILADSHGRDLSTMVQSRTSASVTAYIKPGAKFDSVVGSITELSMGFTKNDYIVVIAGSNNVESGGVQQLKENMFNVIKNLQYTNVIVATLPMRNDKPELEKRIERINNSFKDMISRVGNVKLLELHDIPRHLYTRHGLHYNKLGKNVISIKCVNLIQSEFQPQLTSTNCGEVSNEVIFENGLCTSDPEEPSNQILLIPEAYSHIGGLNEEANKMGVLSPHELNSGATPTISLNYHQPPPNLKT